MTTNRILRQVLPFASLALIVAGLAILTPETFLSGSNLMNVLRRSSVNVVIAVGMTVVIVAGGIDLSVGSVMALCGMTAAWTMLAAGGAQPPGVGAMAVGTLAGALTGVTCGAVNGLLVTRLKLQPFIVTLGTMSMARGISYVMNDGQPYNVPGYTWLGNGVALGMPVSVAIAVAVVLAAALVLRYTPLGRYAYAIGSNREAAYHAGVAVDRCLIGIYTLAGLTVGVAATIATSRTVSAQPTAGIGLELDIVAAVVIGGASLAGGRGSILGTIVGTLLISFLRNGCTLLGISTNVQLIVIGAIIIAAVAVDRVAQATAKGSV